MQGYNDKLFNPEFFEHIPCNLCGANDTDADMLFDADTQRIPKTKSDFIKIYSSSSSSIFYERMVRCRKCGLIYLSPRPKKEIIINSYSLSEDKQYISQEKGRQLTFKNCLKTIKRFCQEGSLLDIGAASGIFVKAAVDAGYKACGLEPSEWMCEFARKHYNVTLLPGEVENAKFKDNSFDIITMWDVLEHIPDPMNTLKEVKRILKPGGFLVINYPRIDDPLSRIFGRHWWFLLSIHLFYFTPKILTAYMEHLEFEKILHKMHFQILEYGYLVERLNVYSPLLAKIAKLAYLIPQSKNFSIPYFASQYLLISKKK
jgi:ubiquinone/menaquinone biosynthesis C-methylase UbiE